MSFRYIYYYYYIEHVKLSYNACPNLSSVLMVQPQIELDGGLNSQSNHLSDSPFHIISCDSSK